MTASHRPCLLTTVGILLASAFLTDPAGGQVPDSLRIPPGVLEPVVLEEDSVPEATGPEVVSPRGAFIRSSLLPGWGHAKVGAFVRGGFYFTVEATAALMIFKTQSGVSLARNRLAMRESVVTARLEADGEPTPAEIEDALANDPEVEDLRALEETRVGQREDWVALGLFFMLIGGADAYVSAHLADFPAAVVIAPKPDRGIEIGLSFPVRF